MSTHALYRLRRRNFHGVQFSLPMLSFMMGRLSAAVGSATRGRSSEVGSCTLGSFGGPSKSRKHTMYSREKNLPKFEVLAALQRKLLLGLALRALLLNPA